jgi:hypothetical protein
MLDSLWWKDNNLENVVVFGPSFVQDYLHVAWQYTYGTKYETRGWTRATMLGKTN